MTCFTYVEDNFIRHQLAWQKNDCSKYHCSIEPILWKECVKIHFEEKTLWSWPIWQNCCQETTIEKAKQCQKTPVGQGIQRLGHRAVEKVLWFDKSKFKILGSKRRGCVKQKIGERAATLSITPTIEHGGDSVMVWRAFANSKVGDLHQVKNKFNQINHHSILQYHRIISEMQLVDPRF